MCKKKLKDIKLIIFDLDGTSLDTDLYVILNHANLIQKHYGKQIYPLSTLINFSGPSLADTFDTYYKDIDKEVLTEEFRDFSLKYTTDFSFLYENELEVLDKLKKAGYILTCFTSKKTEPTQICLKHFGLDRYFEMVVSLEDVKNVKPNPEGIYKILDEFKISKSEAIIIGDSYTDYLAGKNADIKTIFTTWGLKKIENNIKPDYFVNSYNEIKEIFIDE